MVKRIFIFFCSISFLASCSFYQKKELPKESVIDTVIDYNSVDVFPLFPSCDSLPSEEKQKICSQIKLSEHIYASLSSHEIMVSKEMNDTILVKLQVNKNGQVSLINLKSSEFIQQQIPRLDSIIEIGITNLPKLKPAIKRGMPVTTEFTLPIVLIN